MFSLNKFTTPTIAALLLLALPAWSAVAQEGAAGAAAPAAKEQPAAQEKPAAEAQPAAKGAGDQEPPKDEQSAQEQPKGSPNDPLVKVNAAYITRLDRDRAVKVLLAQGQVQEPLPPDVLQQAQDAALEQLVSAELLYQEAAKVEVKDLDKQAAEKVAQKRANFESDAEFEKALKEIDMTPKDMLDFSRKDLIISNFIETRFAAKVVVSDAEAKKFYEENLKKYFTTPESARASHILVGVEEKATPEERKKAKEKAEALLKRVKAGEDFAALAKANSTCPSAPQGGDLGSFNRGQMVGPFEQAAFALKPGGVSDVVETQFGYHIIKLTEKHEATVEKFEDVKAKIADFLKRENTQKAVLDFVEKLRDTAKIEKL